MIFIVSDYMAEIKNQKQVDKLSIKNLNGKKNIYLKVRGIKHLFIRVQSTNNGISASYIFRYTNKNKKSVFLSLGTIHSISLQNAIQEANKRNYTKDYNGIAFNEVQLSIIELLTSYIKFHNLKENTIKSYQTAIIKTCKHLLHLPITDYTEAVINKNFANCTLRQYLSILNILFKWAKQRKLIESNPFENFNYIYAKSPSIHRAALDCGKFDTANDAQKEVSKFLKDLYTYNIKNITLFKLWICHLILGTRVTETARVIKQYQSTNEQIIIETKNTRKGESPNFRIPISSKLQKVLDQIIPKLKKYSISYLVKMINYAIPPSYKGIMSAHGSRSIFRTVIELINPIEFSTEAKEMYLNHLPMNTIQAIYQRSDYLLERKKIQIAYIDWIFSCMPIDITKI